MPTVLIVEPVQFARKQLAHALAVRGYETVEAADGMAAIAAYGIKRPDVVVLEHRLPDMDGLTALRAIRIVDPAASAVFTGPVNDPATVLKARRLGVIDFIAFPLAGNRLFERLGKHLRPVVA